MTGTPVIRTRALSKSYGRHRGLLDLDLDVAAGEVLGVIGPNGAGKSTAIRLLLDLLRPTSGTVSVLGVDPRKGGAGLRRRIGYLAGDLVVPPRLSGAEVVDLMLRLSGAGRDREARTRSRRIAERLGLDLTRPTRTLSKGNRQKIGLVQAFAHAPEVLVLDEPTSGLDPLVQQTFHALVREATDAGATVFMSSHIISEVEQTAHRVAVLRDGRLVALAAVPQLRARATRRVEVEVSGPAGGTSAADGAPVSVPFLLPGLQEATEIAPRHGGTRIAGSFPGEVAALVAQVARLGLDRRVLDLMVAEPDLEEAVLRYYDAGDQTA